MEILRIDDRSVEVSGSVTLVELGEAFGVEEIAPGGRYTSLAGFLLLEFGRMPREGERVARHGFDFEIRSTSARRIERVLVRQAEADETAG